MFVLVRIVCPLLRLQGGCTTSRGHYVHHSQCMTLCGLFPVRSRLILNRNVIFTITALDFVLAPFEALCLESDTLRVFESQQQHCEVDAVIASVFQRQP